jgi:type IV pilus assembly protein PilC
MSTYRYTARTSDGDIVRGSLHATDAATVVTLLRSRMLFVTAVAREADIVERLARAVRVGGAKRAGLLAFFRSVVTLIRAGVSIQRGLAVTIERTTDARLLEALRSMLADVEHGLPLSDAMSRHPRDFPALFIAMVRAGETGGILDDVLERLALLLERETALHQKLRAALAYPAFVMLAASTLIVFLIAKIVPMFAGLFASFHVELPLATRLLLGLGAFLAAPLPWVFIAIAIGAGAIAVYRFAQHPSGAIWLDDLRLRLPIVGPLLHKAIMARVARMLATLLRSGIELVTAIDAIIPVAGSPRYARAFEHVNTALREGESLARPLSDARLFDPLLVALVQVGEETGLLDEMLLRVADYFERDVEATIATLSAVIEPVLIFVLGGIVGFIVFSIFLPLYSLIGGVSQ